MKYPVTDFKPTQIYTQTGMHTITLSVENLYGSHTLVETDFIYVTESASLQVTLTNLSAGGPISWAWDFRDTVTSTLQNPAHIYTTPGVYTVTLTVAYDL